MGQETTDWFAGIKYERVFTGKQSDSSHLNLDKHINLVVDASFLYMQVVTCDSHCIW